MARRCRLYSEGILQMIRKGTYKSGRVTLLVEDGPGDVQTFTIDGEKFVFNVNGYPIFEEVPAPKQSVEDDPFEHTRRRAVPG